MPRIRRIPDEAIIPLLDWCDDNAEARPTHVAACGLAFLRGLGENQMGHIRLLDPERLTVTVPATRHASQMRNADTLDLQLAGTTEWFERALRAHLQAHLDPSSGKLLFPPRSRMQVPLGPQTFYNLVTEAGRLATGYHITPAALNHTRNAVLVERNLPLPLLEAGYSRSWAMQLLGATPEPRPLRAA